MIEISIILGHYAEDSIREEIARKCLIAASKQRNETTELILVMNGIYPYRDEFVRYADQWDEREADTSSGRSWNIGLKMAKGNIFFMLCNDIFLYQGAVAECVRLLKKYKKYLVSPIMPPRYKMQAWGRQVEGGYWVCDRAGDNAFCMTREQLNDIGFSDEIDPLTDGINWINRRIVKGYTVLLTKEPMAKDLAPGKHSFINQMKKYRYKGYKSEIPIYSQEELIKVSYQRDKI